MPAVKPLISAFKQLCQTICNQLTESLDNDEYQTLYGNLKDRISGLEAATGHAGGWGRGWGVLGGGGGELTSSDQGEVQVTLSVARGWQVKLLERINFIVASRQSVPVIKKRSVKL